MPPVGSSICEQSRAQRPIAIGRVAYQAERHLAAEPGPPARSRWRIRRCCLQPDLPRWRLQPEVDQTRSQTPKRRTSRQECDRQLHSTQRRTTPVPTTQPLAVPEQSHRSHHDPATQSASASPTTTRCSSHTMGKSGDHALALRNADSPSRAPSCEQAPFVVAPPLSDLAARALRACNAARAAQWLTLARVRRSGVGMHGPR